MTRSSETATRVLGKEQRWFIFVIGMTSHCPCAQWFSVYQLVATPFVGSFIFPLPTRVKENLQMCVLGLRRKRNNRKQMVQDEKCTWFLLTHANNRPTRNRPLMDCAAQCHLNIQSINTLRSMHGARALDATWFLEFVAKRL